ncbi:hypothetical protein DOY81_006430, partial [Sarcophaga bullata]
MRIWTPSSSVIKFTPNINFPKKNQSQNKKLTASFVFFLKK